MENDLLLPDTCAWIDFFRGKQSLLAQAVERALEEGRVATCGVVLYELVQGIKTAKEELMVVSALQGVLHLEAPANIWIEAGRLSAELRRNGATLPLSDLLIASLALEHQASVLTVDAHFSQVPGLKLLDQ